MLYTIMPYSPEMNYGAVCNQFMEMLPDDAHACILDHDCLLTTYNWYRQISKLITQFPNDVLTAVTNRVGNTSQVDLWAPKTDDVKAHRAYGSRRECQFYGRVRDITLGKQHLSGVMIVIGKPTWKKIGGFLANGILGVDTALHNSVRDKGHRVLAMEGVYVYHYYRGGNISDRRHLKK